MAFTDGGLLFTEQLESGSVDTNAEGTQVTEVYLVELLPGSALWLIPANVESVILGSTGSAAAFQIGVAHGIVTGTKVQKRVVSPVASEKICILTVTYGPDQETFEEDENEEVWRFNLSSEQSHITAVRTESRQQHYPRSGPDPGEGLPYEKVPGEEHDVGTTIGINGDDVDGADVYRPLMRIEVTKKTNETNWLVKKGIAEDGMDKTNTTIWKGYEPGRVLFTGATIEKTKDDEYTFSYTFQVRAAQNEVTFDLSDGSTTDAIDIGPWDHVWFRHKSTVETDTVTSVKTKRKLIEDVHVAQVYESYEFGLFELDGGE